MPQFPEQEVFFGETHVHTAYSFDAFLAGARLDPEAASRFARAEEMAVSGERFRLRRPLDWAAVTDHAEYLGEMETILQADAPGHNNPTVHELLGLSTLEERERWYLNFQKSNLSGKPEHLPFWQGPATTASAWRRSVEASELHNQPGVFSTLIGYEWTLAPGAANLHRNVFFRTAKMPSMVMSALNLNAAGSPIDAGYARTRAWFEPLIEMMPVKGSLKVHRAFWGNDEFAGRTSHQGDFVRAGMIQGLVLQRRLGINPFKLRFAGGTDTHNGTPGNTAEDNFMAGSHGANIDGWLAARDENPAPSLASGPPAIAVRRSGMRCSGARPSRPAAPA